MKCLTRSMQQIILALVFTNDQAAMADYSKDKPQEYV
jgi:hypothetical protein